MAKVQRANIVEPENMICVTVCDEYGIEVFETDAQGLLAKIARRIDDHGLTGMFDQD